MYIVMCKYSELSAVSTHFLYIMKYEPKQNIRFSKICNFMYTK